MDTHPLICFLSIWNHRTLPLGQIYPQETCKKLRCNDSPNHVICLYIAPTTTGLNDFYSLQLWNNCLKEKEMFWKDNRQLTGFKEAKWDNIKWKQCTAKIKPAEQSAQDMLSWPTAWLLALLPLLRATQGCPGSLLLELKSWLEEALDGPGLGNSCDQNQQRTMQPSYCVCSPVNSVWHQRVS